VTDVVITDPGELRISKLTGPQPTPGPGEVVVEVDRVSLCGSDCRLYRGTYGGPHTYPVRFGHEWSGRVAATGPRVDLAVGTEVTGDCSRWCGGCDLCQVDRNLCRQIEKFGLTVDGFSTRRRVVPAQYLYPDPYRLGPRLRALAEPFAVALHAFDRALALQPRPQSVLIVGAGPIGLACALVAARHHHLAAVALCEPDPVRATIAASIVPEVAVEPDGTGRHQLVVECAGSASGVDTAITRADPHGQVVLLGLGHAVPTQLGLAVTKGLRLVGSIGGTGAFPTALAFLDRNRQVAGSLVTGTHVAAKAGDAFAAAVEDQTQLKIQVCFEEDCDVEDDRDA
jgi:L-iditol 2-dehydrogenase